MTAIFKKKSNYPIGLDISDLSLKFVQLHKTKDSIDVQSFSKISLSKGWIENGEIKNKKKVLTHIKKLIDNPKFGKVSSNRVVSCLPEATTFIKLIKIEGDPEDLEEAIIFELNKHIPMSIEDVYYDYQIIKKNSEEKLVIFGAAPKKIVDDYVQLLKEAGLSIQAMEIESTAIARSILLEENPYFLDKKDKNYIIIDMGANRSSVFVYSRGTILFDVSIPISGQRISERISEKSQIDIKKVDLVKIVCGLDNKKCKGIVENNLSLMIDKLISKLEGVIKYYDSHFSEYGALDKILICGGGANIESIDKKIEAKVNIKTEIANPFINLNKPSQVSINLSKPREIFVKNFTEVYKLDANLVENLSFSQKKRKILTVKQDSSITYVTSIGLALRNIFMD